MATKPSPHRTKSAASIGRDAHTILATLHTLLRLLDPASPFQPILLSSIDLVGWLAVFGQQAKQLEAALRALPASRQRTALLKAGERFFSLADTLTAEAAAHASPPAAGTEDGYFREIAAFLPDEARCEDDASAIEAAAARAKTLSARTSSQTELLVAVVDLSTQRLLRSLRGPSGLLRLIRLRCRFSRPFRRQYGSLAERLDGALKNLRTPTELSWEKLRNRLYTLRFVVREELIPGLPSLVRQACSPGTAAKVTTASARPLPKPDEVRKATRNAVGSWLAAVGLVESFDRRLPALQYHTLFSDLLGPLVRAMTSAGMPPPHEQRITDALHGLDERIVRPELLQAWGPMLSEADKHSLQVVLAGLHFLETPVEDGDERSGTPKRIFGFSDNDMATWLRQGTYRGADPLAESSLTKAAEKRRAARTLTHLGQAGAAFHDRRLWTPTHPGKRTSQTHRLWTINPLLAIHHLVAERLIAPAFPKKPTDHRPRPTRRNRTTKARS